MLSKVPRQSAASRLGLTGDLAVGRPLRLFLACAPLFDAPYSTQEATWTETRRMTTEKDLALGDPPVEPARAALMSRIRGKDTKPEMLVRRTAHRLGYRYRLHVKGMAGHPDLVFPARRKVMFVHGCFWHRHPGCKRTTTPKTRHDFWQEKFRRNIERDAAVQGKLEAEGWQVLVIWECETFDEDLLARKIVDFLE